MAIAHRDRGFSLVEMSIVLVIVGALLAGILNARTIIRSSQAKDLIKSINDFAAGVHQFKENYGMFPGDLLNVTVINGMTAACNGNGNGRINSNAESVCATESLIRAGILRRTVNQPITIRNSTLSFTGTTTPTLSGIPAARLTNNAINVVRIQNIDCDFALQIDRAVDDGNVDSGNFITETTCATQDESVVVANAVFKIN